MNRKVKSFRGKEAEVHLMDLAQLRIEVFREYPYLYEGSLTYEKEYLQTFMQSEESIIVVAFDGSKVVGVSTGIPMKFEPETVQRPWIDGKEDIDSIFYFSESVLKKSYRGIGIGVQFFEKREKWARQLGYEIATFCGVIRSENDPRRPADFSPLNRFWKNRGFQMKVGYTCTMRWQEEGEGEETEKLLQYWFKYLD